MKTRTSFVANSSSSSFIIVGEVPNEIFPYDKVELNLEQKQKLIADGFEFDPEKIVYLTQYVSDCCDYTWEREEERNLGIAEAFTDKDVEYRNFQIIPYCEGNHGGPYDDEFYKMIGDNIWIKK